MQRETHKKKHIIILSLISIICIISPHRHVSIESDHLNAHEKSSGKLKRWAYLIGDKKHYRNSSYLDRAFSLLDIVSVTGFRIDGSGRLSISIKGEFLGEIIRRAEKHGVAIYPLVALRSVADGMRLLSDSDARKTAVAELRGFIILKNLQGIHIDFEYLSPDYATKLSVFLKELRMAMGGKRLTMAIFPPVAFPVQYSGFHNLELLAPHLDEIVLMCYDYHRSGTGAGPVTDLGWAEKNIIETLQNIPPDRVWLGVPAYGYAWDGAGKTSVITARRGVKLAKRYRGIRHRSGTIYIAFRQGGTKKQIYFSDSETRRRMAALAERYKLKGTALWRLGFEDE